MKNVVWLLLNTQKWAEPLARTSEDHRPGQSREESDQR